MNQCEKIKIFHTHEKKKSVDKQSNKKFKKIEKMIFQVPRKSKADTRVEEKYEYSFNQKAKYVEAIFQPTVVNGNQKYIL